MEVDYQIYNKSTYADYIKLLSELKLELDIYYYPSFLDIDAKIQKGEYEIFFFRKGNDVFIYPYIKLPFKEEKFKRYFDISSPYGYCGPFCTSELIFQEGEDAFITYIKNNCVSEFVRYHYIYNDELKFTKQIQNLRNRLIVTLSLNQSWEEIWSKEYSSTNRNLIRKLEKEGYLYSVTRKKEDLDEFVEMYYLTMKNVNADSFYFFDNELLYELFEKLGEKIILSKVTKNEITYCYSLFFVTKNIATYYLSARNLEHSKTPATNFLLSKTIEFLMKQNISLLNFGGGITDDLNDMLLKFKSNFSKSKSNFCIGKRVFNQKKYQQISDEWITIQGKDNFEERKHILQFYR